MLLFNLEQISDSDDIGAYTVSRIEIDRLQGLMTIYTKTATSTQYERSERFLDQLSKIVEDFGAELEFDHPTEIHRRLFHILGVPGQYENHFHITFKANQLNENYDKIIGVLGSISNGLHPDFLKALAKYDPEFRDQKPHFLDTGNESTDSDIFEDDMSIFFMGPSQKENIPPSNAEKSQDLEMKSNYMTIR
ncbi:MAG: hypothetical protein U1E78_03700 [Gammaproteobacteria bacterium]